MVSKFPNEKNQSHIHFVQNLGTCAARTGESFLSDPGQLTRGITGSYRSQNMAEISRTIQMSREQ